MAPGRPRKPCERAGQHDMPRATFHHARQDGADGAQDPPMKLMSAICSASSWRHSVGLHRPIDPGKIDQSRQSARSRPPPHPRIAALDIDRPRAALARQGGDKLCQPVGVRAETITSAPRGTGPARPLAPGPRTRRSACISFHASPRSGPFRRRRARRMVADQFAHGNPELAELAAIHDGPVRCQIHQSVVYQVRDRRRCRPGANDSEPDGRPFLLALTHTHQIVGLGPDHAALRPPSAAIPGSGSGRCHR